MRESIRKILLSDDGRERVLIIQRVDGVWSYRRQWRSRLMNSDPDSPIVTQDEAATGEWGESGPYCGLYDSAESAENEARGRVPWLVSMFH